MKLIQVRVCFEDTQSFLAEEVIADIFIEAGFEGVAITDKHLEPEEGWDPGDVSRDKDNSVTGYMDSDLLTDPVQETVKRRLEMLRENFDLAYTFETVVVANEDWNEKWKEHFYPEKVGEKIVVKPSWREYSKKDGEIVIDLDPGMAFGTGSHPTTALCVGFIEKYLKNNNSFLDIGTGSGILLITAAKLGASDLAGTDNDSLAIEAASDNLVKNNIDINAVRLMESNLIDGLLEPPVKTFDLIVANILSGVIIRLLDDLGKVTIKGSVVIFSGILEENVDIVREKIIQSGFDIIEIKLKESWAGIVCTRL